MISFRGSSALKPSKLCKEAPRSQDQTNEEWLRAQIEDLDDKSPASYVVLLGGASVYDFRLRVAQSHVRADMTPSHWSHAALISSPSMNNRTQVLEASLEPYEGFQIPSRHNGLQIAPLRRYSSTDQYPNIAVIKVPVDSAEWRSKRGGQKSILTQFSEQRVVLDVTSLLLEWLAFVWGAGAAGNPLLNGHGVPSAAVIEALLGAAGYDMSPGLDTSASSPEAFWQSAKWWQDYYADLDIPQMVSRYHVSDAPVHEDVEPRGPRKRTAKKTSERAEGQVRSSPSSEPRLPRPTMFAADSMTAAVFQEE